MFNSGIIYAVAHAPMTELMLFPRNRWSVCGLFHNRIIIIDTAEQPEDAADTHHQKFCPYTPHWLTTSCVCATGKAAPKWKFLPDGHA
jgi:hypothetical protein